MSALFSPLTIRGIDFKNRIIVSPMCQYSSEDGFANDWHLVHLGSRAVGGAALVMTEATAVSPEGRISPQDLGIWKDEHIDALKRITTFIEAQNCVPGIQLAHAGRKASTTAPWLGDHYISLLDGGWQTVAPSAIAFAEETALPHSLSLQEINGIVLAFKKAAQRAYSAGFKVLEIHGAHGYLINEFLSPLSNKRTDEYGGTIQNRLQFLIEIISTIREAWPVDYPLFLRISASDWVDGGWTIDDSIVLANVVKEKGVDLIDCSSGGVVSGVKIPAKPGYQVPFAKAIRQATGMLTGAVGIIVDPAQADKIIADGEADMVLMARELLRNPYFPLKAASELHDLIEWPLQYERAKRNK
ncbi:MAG: NADPH dehydrogenase NamA [Taibaiella sp.]|nr:NADPH dehydrogenase NamA [Taibaiella sp.]